MVPAAIHYFTQYKIKFINYDEARPSKAKAFFGTHPSTTTVHRTVAILTDCSFRASFLIKNKKHHRNGAFCFGADDEARTRYLNLGKVALYRVSYIRECKIDYTQQLCTCQDFFEKNVTIYLFTTMHFFVII